MARTIKLEFIHCYFFINFIEVQISCHLTFHLAFSIRLGSAFSLPYLVIAVLLCILNQIDFGNLTPISISFISSTYSSGSKDARESSSLDWFLEGTSFPFSSHFLRFQLLILQFHHKSQLAIKHTWLKPSSL